MYRRFESYVLRKIVLLAQLEECFRDMEEVIGSSPIQNTDMSVAEWLKALVSKTSKNNILREFESSLTCDIPP
jgi:hypothetical protein